MNDNKQNVSLYDFKGHQVRVVELDGNPWFVAVDVCAALGLTNTTQAVKNLSKDEKTFNNVEGMRGRAACFISEPGLYKVLQRSRRPEALTFDRWVRHKVLPSIRKNGGYVKDQEKVATGEMAPQELVLKGYEALLKIVDDMRERAVKAEAQVEY